MFRPDEQPKKRRWRSCAARDADWPVIRPVQRSLRTVLSSRSVKPAPLRAGHAPADATQPRLKPRRLFRRHQQPRVARVLVQPTAEVGVQVCDIRRTPQCIRRDSHHHTRRCVLHRHHPDALAPDLEGCRFGIARVQFKALLGLRGHEAERITSQQPVIERMQRLIGPHLLACRFGPVHPRRNDQEGARRRSDNTVMLHSSPRVQTESHVWQRTLTPAAAPVRG